MTRKRFVKLLMSRGFTRNAATFRARFYIQVCIVLIWNVTE